MLVKFRTNVGSVDAGEMGLDFKKCQRGMTLEVTDKQASTLIAKKLAEAARIEGVAKSAEISHSKQPPIAAKTK